MIKVNDNRVEVEQKFLEIDLPFTTACNGYVSIYSKDYEANMYVVTTIAIKTGKIESYAYNLFENVLNSQEDSEVKCDLEINVL